MPLVAPVKLALLPEHTAVADGSVVMAGVVFTVSVAAEEVDDAQPALLTNARY